MIINASTDIYIENYNNGLYVFDCNGATGKSRIAKILASLQAVGERYGVVTVINGVLSMYGDVETAELVLLDRFDLYISDKWINKIKELKDKCTILVDLKQLGNLKMEYGFADIEMSEDRIELRLL